MIIMNKSILLTITAILIYSLNVVAQVGINADNSNPDASAMLDVKSTEKGILVPRMTTAQRTIISTPATGLLVFDTDTGGFWFYNGSVWADLSANGDGDTDATNEYNTGIILNGTSLETTDNGGTITTDLSGLQDEDWLRTNGNIPTGISQAIYRTGNIGIGSAASNPSFPLDIIGTSGERIRTYSNDGLYAGLVAKNSTREFFVGIQASYETNNTSSGFHIYDNTTGSQRMVIDENGYMGLNQANPDS